MQGRQPHCEESSKQGLARLQSILDESRRAPMEEAVPAEMMQVFSDDQWPVLLFEFQPSMRIFSACQDIVSLHRSGVAHKGTVSAGPIRQWLIFRRKDEQLIRPLDALENRALEMARAGSNFSAIAEAVWPDLETEKRQTEMTTMLVGWLEEGLVIDAGVPIPDDAEILD